MNQGIRFFGVLAIAAWGTACTAEMAETEEQGDTSEAVRRARCGNGAVEYGEQCDDGNRNNRDGCTNQCKIRRHGRCGDGTVDAGEECDDGNSVNTDFCSNVCQVAACGDGIVQPGNGEECDDAGAVGGCPNNCQSSTPETCGNGEVDTGEECDDGNTVNTDGCTNACGIPACGDGVVQGALGEECDDGNANDGDACGNDCLMN